MTTAYPIQGTREHPVSRAAEGLRAEPRACEVCGQWFAPHKRRNGARYCSRPCIWIAACGPEFNAKVARDTANLRGDLLRGRGEGKSYRKRGGRHEHRAVAEEKLGRALRPGEIVHHSDEAIHNNQPSNLAVIVSQAEHARLHFTGKKQSAEQIRKRVEATRRTKERRA